MEQLATLGVWLGRNVEPISAIITTLLAIWVALLSISNVARWYTEFQLKRARRITVGRTLASAGVSRKERSRWIAEASSVSSPIDEISILLDVLPRRDSTATVEPFLLKIDGQGALDAATARELVAAYKKSVSRLESRVLFATAATPAISNAVVSMRAVVEILNSYIDGSVGQRTTELTYRFSPKCLAKVFDLDSTESGITISGNVPRDIAVTYRPMPVRDTKTPRVQSHQIREYDGHLPWLTSFRAETDQSNGRPRLHFSFETATYSRYKEYNSIRLGMDPEAEWPVDGLLSLSVIALDNSGRLLAVRRGPGLMYAAGRLSSFATGNLDLKTRRHLNLDVDALGLPSPVEAARREIREETGIDLGPERIHAIGLGRLWSSEKGALDLGTYHLHFVATTDMTAETVVREFTHADPVEGAWEVGREMLAISIPDNPRDVADLVRWMSATEGAVAQLSTGILLLASTRGMRLSDLVRYLDKSTVTKADKRFDELVDRFSIPSPLNPAQGL
ncbi:hypothetical protein FB389_1355 [Rarobacter incanus]|uniref:Nudix hydrolase domain-containing protein n=2 Tax=Rarobacter incanus TaxID=153494 RepID=A0A542SQ17_9MICO|nr:hypothetical protein FB389_1355 [Rarobacter incanus]